MILDNLTTLFRTLLSFYVRKKDIESITGSGVSAEKINSYDTHIKELTIHVTEADKNVWNAKQPAISDLSDIRAKANSALQEHQDISGKANKATTLSGYGITDAYTKTEVNAAIEAGGKVKKVDGVDPDATGNVVLNLSNKANKATTLSGYGITDAYTKAETGSAISTAIAGVVASAPEKFDTLKEIADWIDSDTTGAAKMANDISAINTTISDYATVKSNAATGAGLKTKVDGIEAGANKYVHPSTHAASMITGLSTVATSGNYSDLSNKPNTMTAATSSTAGTGGLVPAPAAGKQVSFLRGDGTWAVPTNTKNTVGSTDTSSKIFLVGATSQSANPTSYSHDTVYVDTDGCLYSDGTKVSVEGHTHSQYLTAHQSLTEYQKKTDNLDMGAL